MQRQANPAFLQHPWMQRVKHGHTEYDLQEEITKYYKLFYGCDLTNAMYQNLIADALPK